MRNYIAVLLIITACHTKSKSVTLQNKVKSNTNITSIIDSIRSIINEGDIIFRGGTDIESAIIREFSYKDKLFSHCGIVTKQNDTLFITHILGGTTNPAGKILNQSVSDFFKYPDNECAGVYDINITKNELALLCKYINSLKAKNITFDLKFNLLDKSKLYCSEFLIDGLKYAMPNTKFPHTSYYLKNTKYQSVANKGDSFLFYPIDKLQHHPHLKQKAIFYFPNFNK